MKNHTDHEEARETLWREVWVAVARSDTITSTEHCTQWADTALADFDERFNPDAHAQRAEDRKVELEKERAKEAKSKPKAAK